MRFCTEEEGQAHRVGIKQRRCPCCGEIGFLICHGHLWGYAAPTSEMRRRGHRFFCSNRGNREGCGHTYSILFTRCLPRRQLSAPQLDELIDHLLRGSCRGRARSAAGFPFSLQHVYGVWKTLRTNMPRLRALLCRLCFPPRVRRSEPLLQLFEHLRAAFAHAPSPIEAFQHRFDEPFLA
jgi:hypothetical protein